MAARLQGALAGMDVGAIASNAAADGGVGLRGPTASGADGEAATLSLRRELLSGSPSLLSSNTALLSNLTRSGALPATALEQLRYGGASGRRPASTSTPKHQKQANAPNMQAVFA